MDDNRCLRCGAPHEPDATICLSCGAPIGETQSPTQPVRAIKVPRPEVAAETSTPASASEATANAASPASVAVAASAAPATRGKHQWPIVLLICVFVLALLAGAAYAVRTLTAAPPVARQTIYHDPQHRFSFQRPALWIVSPNPDGGVTVSDTAGSSTVKIAVLAAAAATSAKAYADQRAEQLGIGADSPRAVAGEQWEQRSGTVTGSDGAERQYVLLVTVHGGQLYSIECASPVASFDGTNTLVFQPLLASFTFT
ncbi:MAG TPA: hypothetical protein VE258_16245 [Ktedonobacterales bacterium]|nr:hypothetical protein [Ktedonobacterales bacterium]